MIRSIAGRLTYANVMATVAVFMAMGGVSYAATQLPKNSVGSAQIKKGAVTKAKIDPKLVASLTGKAGATGAAGDKGATGATGAPGTAGLAGAKGDTGAAGAAGAKGDAGTNGTNGAPGTDGNDGAPGTDGDDGAPGADGNGLTTLGTGETESGAWATGAAPATTNMFAAISFARPLPAAIAADHAIYVTATTPSGHCAGAGQAEAGYLCVYEGVINATFADIRDPDGAPGASAQGAYVRLTSAAGTGIAAGSWAVTAP